MPWQEQTTMELREEFVALARHPDANVRAVCRSFGISAKTGYKYLRRAAMGESVADHSRRPHTSPTRTDATVEAAVIALRREHPTWGGRKLHHALLAQGMAPVPAPSTITGIVRRAGLLLPTSAHPPDWQRFEHPYPNDLWQMDFFGHRPLADGSRVHPLTVIDDHSRMLIGLFACANEQHATVQAHLITLFQRYGMPRMLLTDNGPPWGSSGNGGITALEAWLLQYGIEVRHGRPGHPQTQGKAERFHATLAADLFAHRTLTDLAHAQQLFDHFRDVYNQQRPHEALNHAVPISRYQLSPRVFPATTPPPQYAPGDAVRLVRSQGAIGFRNQSWFISSGLSGLPVAVRPTCEPLLFQVLFCHREVKRLDLTTRETV
jgi:transposase InsO family protein